MLIKELKYTAPDKLEQPWNIDTKVSEPPTTLSFGNWGAPVNPVQLKNVSLKVYVPYTFWRFGNFGVPVRL